MNSAMIDDEEESYLDPSEQTQRPADVAVQQQRVEAWHPILDPEWMIYTFLILAVIMIPVGFRLESISENLVEIKKVYDGVGSEFPECKIGMDYNANKNCTLTFTATKDLEPPILIHYELTNFHQNHRSYAFSRDDAQLAGRTSGQDEVSAEACAPINKLGEVVVNPCGLIANTFFNDVFRLRKGSKDANGEDLVMVEEGIAWESDLEFRFNMPNGYQQELCPEGQCDESCCADLNYSCQKPARSKSDGQCYAYDYPNDDTTQYLYETYPNVISPLEHVTNEHFVVWMRVATRPTFRKLYGYIEERIPAGTELIFDVNLNYVAESFGGTKALIVSTNNIVGGKNPELGPTFYYMGFFCLFCGLMFATKHWFRPRKIADRKYLHYKEE